MSKITIHESTTGVASSSNKFTYPNDDSMRRSLDFGANWTYSQDKCYLCGSEVLYRVGYFYDRCFVCSYCVEKLIREHLENRAE